MIDLQGIMLEELGESVRILTEDLDKLRNKLYKINPKELCENNAGNFVIRNTKTHSRHKH
jgi:hypothetical protein